MKKHSGFTLVELVIVVVILGFLAVTAIPKFLDLSDQAQQANIKGMAGGFASGISLARAQWEAEARPNNGGSPSVNIVNYDGVNLVLTSEDKANGIRPGYVTGLTDGETLSGAFDSTNCVEIWQNILQQPPGVSTNINDLNNDNLNIQYLTEETGDNAASTCKYYLRETLAKNSGGSYVSTDKDNVANYFTYQPATSKVDIIINN